MKEILYRNWPTREMADGRHSRQSICKQGAVNEVLEGTSDRRRVKVVRA